MAAAVEKLDVAGAKHRLSPQQRHCHLHQINIK